MKTIFKYNLKIYSDKDGDAVSEWELPEDYRVLSCGVQSTGRNTEMLAMWVLLDTEKPKHKRRFHVFMTGQPIREDVDRLMFVQTVQFSSGIVAHVFEEFILEEPVVVTLEHTRSDP